MPASAAYPSVIPENMHAATVANSNTAGMANASVTAFAPLEVSVATITFCPTEKRSALLHLTSINFSLLSEDVQYDATLHAAHELLCTIRTFTTSPEMLSTMPEWEISVLMLCCVRARTLFCVLSECFCKLQCLHCNCKSTIILWKNKIFQKKYHRFIKILPYFTVFLVTSVEK